MTRPSALRASDADREQIAERLRKAATEGRLLAEELEQRIGATFAARTYGELDALVADLPDDRGLARRSQPVRMAVPATALAVGVLAGVVLVVLFVLVVTGTIVGGAWVLFAIWFFACRGGRYRGRYGRGGPARGRRYGDSAGFAPWH
jgi:tetrahydromethanopterin S-methyltransferase subunit F